MYLSFFSPSGYENKKNVPLAKHVFYLPSDTREHAKILFDSIKPHIIFFVKYEIWANYLQEAFDRKIPVFLVRAVFLKHLIQTYALFLAFWGDFLGYRTLKSNLITNIV